MTTLLFYKKPVAIDRVQHRDLKVKMFSGGFSYAAQTNSLPLTAVEFAIACQTYPIVFVLDQQGAGMPVALTGLRDAENLFLEQDGAWAASDGLSYIPAFVRRYPFVLQTDNTAQFRVLVDEQASGYADPEGQSLFNADGSNSAFLTNMIEMLDQYSAAGRQTEDFVRQLRSLDLLVPREVGATTKSGKNFQMNGFWVVDESKLSALSDDVLLSLVRSGRLGWITAHLISLGNIQRLLNRLERRLAA